MIQNAGNSGGLKVIASGRLTGTPLGTVTFPTPAAFVFVIEMESAMSSYYTGDVRLLTPGQQTLNIKGNPWFLSDGTQLKLTSGDTGTTQFVDYVALG